MHLAEYRLYGFGESGNAYKVALMLELCGADWETVFVDYFNGATRDRGFRHDVNGLGEVPALDHRGRILTQSGVILTYLSRRLGAFGPRDEEEELEILRWLLFDNHKFTSYLATLRFMHAFQKAGDTPVTAFMTARVETVLGLVEAHLDGRSFMLGEHPTIADLSMCGYVYFRDETPLDWSRWPRLIGWADRIAALPGWRHPYALMPRSYREPAVG